jgi:predicted dehydrogenase
MRAVIAGLGSIGKRHLNNLQRVLPDCDIAVWRHSRESAAVDGLSTSIQSLYDVAEVLDYRPDFAILASPAPYHVSAALKLAAAGVHLLVEKPLADSERDVEALLELCRQRQLTLMVAYNLRFHESLREAHRLLRDGCVGRIIAVRAEVGSYLPDWRPGSDYRRVVSARPELGGGAVLELSHEIDYVRWLGGEVTAVSAQLGNLGGLDIPVEDTAELTLRFASGAIGQIHVDMVQRAPHRMCRIIGTEGTLVWDGIANSLQLYRASTRAWEVPWPARDLDRNGMYIEELAHFVDCMRHQRTPLITGEDGWRVLQIALAAKRSNQEQRSMTL